MRKRPLVCAIVILLCLFFTVSIALAEHRGSSPSISWNSIAKRIVRHYLAIVNAEDNARPDVAVDDGVGDFNDGVGAIERQDVGQAISCFHRAVDKAAQYNNTQVLFYGNFNLGVCNFRQGQIDEAGANFKSATDYGALINDPALYAKAYEFLGFACSTRMMFDEAIAAYTNAINIGGPRIDSYYFRGNAYGARGNYDNALADFSETIRLGNVDGYYRRAMVYMMRNANKEAAASFRMFVNSAGYDNPLRGPAQQMLARLGG